MTFFDDLPVDLSIEFLGKKFINPFILAAVPSSDEMDMLERAFDAGWAGAVLKTTNIKGAKDDLAYPLIAGDKDFQGNSTILGNIDLTSAYSIEEIEKRVEKIKIKYSNRIIVVSISGSNKEEWTELSKRASQSGADLIECSFSCPQGSLGLNPGEMLGQNEEASKEVTSWIVDASNNVPVVIKLTPQVANVGKIAKSVVDAGASAVCLGNSMPGILNIDINKLSPEPSIEGLGTTCGISGESIKPISLRSIALASKLGVKIVASGGMVTWRHALESLMLGANVVQFGTAVMFYGFDIIEDLKSGLSSYLYRNGLKEISQVVGKALPNFVDHSDLKKGLKVRPNIDLERCVGDGACVVACRDGGHMAITFSNDRKPIVDDLKCVGCGLCSAVCPIRDCIFMENK